MRLKAEPVSLQAANHSEATLRRNLPGGTGWRAKALALLRVFFGIIWAVAACLKWQPQFQSAYLAQINSAKAGQPQAIQVWISWWASVVSINPWLFARLEASTETALAVLLVLGLFSNATYIVGMCLSLGIWATAEGFGGPYRPGQSTDAGTALPYVLLFAVLLVTSAGRYYSLDQWLTPRLSRLGFLAAGSFWKKSPGKEHV
jgi:uncharacterized membrane protein YphA (DoxX/SURF4 family)